VAVEGEQVPLAQTVHHQALALGVPEQLHHILVPQ
jgi:hypothetical protein